MENKPTTYLCKGTNKSLHRSYSATFGNAVCPKQCRAAFQHLMNKSLTGGEVTEELPRCGYALVRPGMPVCSIVEWKDSDFAATPEFKSDLLFPTPTFCDRSNKGSCVIARRLFLRRRLKFLDAAAVCGRCPHLRKDTMEEYSPVSHFDADPDHAANCSVKFVYHRNYEFDEWLMGFPKGYISYICEKSKVSTIGSSKIKTKIKK
jgi:hypothetical protein